MSKVKYLFNRIIRMDFKRFFKTINDIHKESKKNRIFLFFDCIWCGLKYQAGYLDYKLFLMYNMNSKERKTIVTRGKNNEIHKRYNDPSYTKYFNDKKLFNERFDKYLNRKWMVIDEDNFSEFKEFIKNMEYVIVKPLDGTCGKGVEKIKVKDNDAKKLFSTLLKNKQVLIEEVATQCKTISDLHPTSINTVRLVTLKGHTLVAFLRIGNLGNVVDNLNHDGIAAPIDIKDGIIKYPATDKEHNVYAVHPYTNKKIVGVKIPKWKDVIELCEEASKEIPEVGYIGWDVCIGEDKVFLIEGNDFPGHDIYQLPPHREGNIGLYPLFQKVMKEVDNK